MIRRDTNGDLRSLAFLLIHGAKLPVPPGTRGVAGKRLSPDEANQYLEDRLTKIAAITHLTGTDFFPDLPAGTKAALEQAAPTQLWPADFVSAPSRGVQSAQLAWIMRE